MGSSSIAFPIGYISNVSIILTVNQVITKYVLNL